MKSSRVLRSWREYGVKAVAVLLTALLATQMVGTPAFASLEQSEKAAEEQIATEVKDVAADEPAETTATETETSNATEGDESSNASNEAESDASGTASAASSESNSASTEPAASDQQVDVQLDLAAETTLSYDGATYGSGDESMKAPANEELKFTVSASEGYQVESVETTIDGVAAALEANEAGEYTIDAADLTDGEKIVVTTEAVPTEEPAEDATPVEPEETTEDESASAEEAVQNDAPVASNGASTMAGRVAEVQMTVGESRTIYGENPSGDFGGGSSDHRWTVEGSAVRIVSGSRSANVTVRAAEAGTATLKHTYTYQSWFGGDKETRTESITVEVARALEVTIDNGTIEASSTTTAHAEGATGSVKWESSNPSVAQVTSNGRVIGVSKGTAQITATDSTGATGSVSVRVTPMMCTITFVLNGGQWSGNDGLKEGANKREFGSQLWSSGDLASPTRDGYYFTGWTPTVSKTVVGDATYRANWKRISDLTPVYVYTKVDGTEEDKEGLILNNEGWYTLGVIFVPSWLCYPDAPQNTTVNLSSPYNMGQIESALNEITAYLPNASLLEYIDEIDWTKLHVQNGANDYVPSGPEVRPVSSWHLDGELDASRLATLTVNYIDVETDEEIISSDYFTVGVGTYQSADTYRIEIANYTYDHAEPNGVQVTKQGPNEINLYYTHQKASLQYDLNADSGITGEAPATQRGYIEDSVTVAGADGFSRAGYNFVSWNTAFDGSGTTYLAGRQFTFTDQTTTTLYAQWEKDAALWHSVTYVDGVDGEEIDVPAGSASVLQGTEYTVSDQKPERTGWTFTGWKTTDVTGSEQTFQAEGTFTMPNKDVTLEAQWEAKSGIAYTVEFYFQDPTDGSFKIDEGLTDETRTGTTEQPVSVTEQDKAVQRDNYVFDEGNEANVLSDDSLNGDGTTTLKVYYKLSLDVTYDLNGGTSDEELSYPGLDWDDKTPTISAPTRDGYAFTGWKPEVAETVTGDATYVAQWEPNFDDFGIVADAEGGHWTYDGSKRKIELEGVYPGDELKYVITYADKTTEEVIATVAADGTITDEPMFKDFSDTSAVVVTVTRGGQTDQASTAMTIDKVQITVTDQKSALFDGSQKTLTIGEGDAGQYKVNGKTVDGETLKVTAKVTGTEVGSHTDVVGTAEGGSIWTIENGLPENYDVKVNGTLRIFAQSIDDDDPEFPDPTDPEPADPDPNDPDTPDDTDYYGGVTVKLDGPDDTPYNGAEQKLPFKVLDKDGNDLSTQYYDYEYSGDTTNVGEVTITITGKNGYSGTAELKYRITKVDLLITTASDVKIYDGTALTNPGITFGDADGSKGFQGDDANKVSIYTTGTQTEVGTSWNSYGVDDPDNVLRNYNVTASLGTLKVVASSIDPDDPDPLPDPDDPVVPDPDDPDNPDPVDPNPDPDNPDPDVYGGVTVDEPQDSVYDGTDNKWAPVVTSDDGQTLVEGTDYTVAYFRNGQATDTFSDAGTIEVVITGIGGYSGTYEDSYVISPRPITVVTDSASKVYDGTALTAAGRVENLVAGETVTVNTSSRTEVGTSDNLYTLTWGTADPANYTIVGETIGTLTVTAVPVTPIPTPDPDGGDDDGTDDGTTPATDPGTADDATAEEAIAEGEIPLAASAGGVEIVDDATPMAGGDHPDCWVHWFMILGIVVTVAYTAGVVGRRSKFSGDLKDYEDKVLGNNQNNQ